LIDVLDRVLDKGIVVDADMRVTLAGIDLTSVDGRFLVASFDTHLAQAAAGRSGRFARPNDAANTRERRSRRPAATEGR